MWQMESGEVWNNANAVSDIFVAVVVVAAASLYKLPILKGVWVSSNAKMIMRRILKEFSSLLLIVVSLFRNKG